MLAMAMAAVTFAVLTSCPDVLSPSRRIWPAEDMLLVCRTRPPATLVHAHNEAPFPENAKKQRCPWGGIPSQTHETFAAAQTRQWQADSGVRALGVLFSLPKAYRGGKNMDGAPYTPRK